MLGSYSNQSNAISEQSRLSRLLDQQVEILFDERQAVFRVVIEEGVADETLLAGLGTWQLNVDVPITATELESQSVTNDPQEIVLKAAKAMEQTIRATDPDTMSPLYPAFEPGETLSAYCDRLPDSRLCLHPRMQQAIERDRKLAAHRAAVRQACEVMEDSDLRDTCLELRGQ